jgi:hypothetical protein
MTPVLIIRRVVRRRVAASTSCRSTFFCYCIFVAENLQNFVLARLFIYTPFEWPFALFRKKSYLTLKPLFMFYVLVLHATATRIHYVNHLKIMLHFTHVLLQ